MLFLLKLGRTWKPFISCTRLFNAASFLPHLAVSSFPAPPPGYYHDSSVFSVIISRKKIKCKYSSCWTDDRFYSKMRYVKTLNLLRNNVRWDQIEMPEFVYEYDDEKEEEYCPKMDFGLESDHPRLSNYRAPSLDCTVSTYSMRSIA